MDDVASGAVRYLTQFADVTAMLGSFSLSDPQTANAGRPWLFADNNQGVLATMEGSSAAAVVCGDFGGWDASLPLTDGGERFLHRHELEELLDDAEEIAAGGDPRANPG